MSDLTREFTSAGDVPEGRARAAASTPPARDPFDALRPLLVATVADLPAAALHARLTGARDRVCRLHPLVEDGWRSDARLDDARAHRFEFNAEAHDLGTDIDWLRNPSQDIEWHILLHKFHYLVGLAERYRAAGDVRDLHAVEQLCQSWMRQVPVGYIAADVTARRVQNWLYALRLVCAAPHAARPSPNFMATLLASVVAQVEHVRANLAPARNHRTLELYAVFIAGIALPELRAAAGWREHATRELAQNLRTDFHADGAHVELSTDYHHLALRSFVLWLQHLRANELAVPRGVLPRLHAAFDFALHVQRPDGVIPALSDGDAEDYRPLLELGARLLQRPDLAWAASGGTAGKAPTHSSREFEDAGYVVLRSGWGTRRDYRDETFVVADCGPLGAGNHGHLDALSFEYYARGAARIVDPGRGTYDEQGEVNWRVHFRRTAAHNTVTIDDHEQAPYAYSPRHGKFRVQAPHAQTRRIVLDAGRHALRGALRDDLRDGAPPWAPDAASTADMLHGRTRSTAHDACHDRRWLRVGQDYLLTVDDLRAGSVHDYRLHLHLDAANQGHARLDPCGTALQARGLTVQLGCTGGQDPSPKLTLLDDVVAPRYGELLPAPHLVAHCRAGNASLVTLLAVQDGDAAAPRLRDAGNRAWHDVAGIARPARACGNRTPALWRIDLPALGAGVHDLVGLAAVDDDVAAGALARPWQLERLRVSARWFVARIAGGHVCVLWLPADAERIA